jgi:two-component system, response regulator PdtaR
MNSPMDDKGTKDRRTERPSAPHATAAPSDAMPTRDPLARVLVVEDDRLVRMPVTDALREAGYDVVEAETADAAWDLLTHDKGVDLVFSDIRTPGAMDGVDLAMRLHAELPQLPVILATGYNPRHIPLGHIEVLHKPYKVEDMVEAVTRRLAGCVKRS